MNRATRRVVKLGLEDAQRVARNEEVIKESAAYQRLADLPNFPYSTMHDLWSARDRNEIFVDAHSVHTETLSAFGSSREVLTSASLCYLPGVAALAYVGAAIVQREFGLLWGLLFLAVGFIAAPLSVVLVPLALVWTIFFAKGVWLWIGVGILFSLVCGLAFRANFKAAIDEIAISSEVIFCHLYTTGLVSLVNRQTKERFRFLG